MKSKIIKIKVDKGHRYVMVNAKFIQTWALREKIFVVSAFKNGYIKFNCYGK